MISGGQLQQKRCQKHIPKRALYAGALFAFELKLLTSDEELDFTRLKSVQGYKIQIHHPSMLPRVKQQHFRLPLDQGVLAAIMPSMITTSDDIKHYPPERRLCLFPSERSLKYFKVYTQQNYQIECKTNFTVEMCDCVDFYMPQDLLSQGIENQLRLYEGLPPEDNAAYRMSQRCNCMPECTSMTYIIETSQADWDWVRKFQFDRNASNLNKSTYVNLLTILK
ncbi:ASC domain containing protein [Asbolus verrucosus]|uniref:ASC domain containing protein n=1 Tax=Asbolus verrucosus TaxID=1661398 RepID=A0A482VWE7_ASBVE|nr:ASC domain containing protein [Asbolus verrucosus]